MRGYYESCFYNIWLNYDDNWIHSLQRSTGISNMKFLLIIASLLVCSISKANDESRAMRALQKAAMSYPIIKTSIKNAENHFYTLVPLDKTDLVYFSPLAAIIDKKISTSKFKNLVWKKDSLIIDPDVTYAYSEELWLITLNVKYTF